MLRLRSLFGFTIERMVQRWSTGNRLHSATSSGHRHHPLTLPFEKREWSILLTFEDLTEFSQFDLPGLSEIIDVDALPRIGTSYVNLDVEHNLIRGRN
jgi:hypothetical protein